MDTPTPAAVRSLARLLLATLLASQAGCAHTAERAGEISDREKYWYYAKPAIPSFSTTGRISGWKPLGRNELVVWTRFDEAYILRVAPGCFELDGALGIQVESRVSGTVSSGFDSVRVGRNRCRILEIHPVDYKLLKQEERELREDRRKEEASGDPAEEGAQDPGQAEDAPKEAG